MDADTREQLLDEFRKLCAEAFHYAFRSVYNDLMRMDTDSHPRFKALQIYLTEDDSTNRTFKIARYAAEQMLFSFFVAIEESDLFDIVAKEEGRGPQSVPEISELFPQEVSEALKDYSDYGSTTAKLLDLYVELTKPK
jgi:hypothetical protein